jgi:hypothetical protein
MWFIKRNRSADWNAKRERDWERGRALRALRNAVFFLVFGFAVLGAAFVQAWNKGSAEPAPAAPVRERAAVGSCRF